MSKELTANTILSHYRVVSRIGAGGMGEVWLAEDTRLERRVALKLLPAEFTQDAGRVRRFMQEAKAASALNHPNIITVYDIGESDAGRFIVMELVAGRTLRSVIDEDNSLETFLTLGGQMAKALSAAHAAGITHRDIKPDNIMVREDGYVKVLDFGLARLLPTAPVEDAATLALQTTPDMIMGTVAYMSPEQASGQSVGPPSDVFALGIVLYELVTGLHPFRAQTLVGYLHAITSQTPPPLNQLRPGIPAAVDELILGMLKKDASQRPSASEVSNLLQEVERHGDTTKRQPDDGETVLLPTAQVGTARADEGFWVAVLPFKSRGAKADLESLAEGLTEDIVTGLSRFSYLRVIARSSTLRYASDSSDVRAIGKEVGARYVMEGNLRQAGSMLRVAVQLLDAETGAHLWAETYDRQYSAEQIFILQDDLVPRIVSTVADSYGILPHSMSQAVRSKATDQLTPYEALLRSFSYVERVTAEEHAKARAALERAVQKAPGDSDCWAMLSILLTDEHIHGFSSKTDLLERAVQLARRAVDANPLNHRAYQALAWALCYRKEFDACRHAAERTVALNPMDASAMAYVGQTIAYGGGWERGCELLQRAMQLNPHHPGWYRYAGFLNAYRQADYRGALNIALKMNMPGVSLVYVALGAAYGQLGELEAAREAVSELLALRPDFKIAARTELEKLWDSDLVDRLIDGLRKAGLGVDADEEREEPSPTRHASGEKRADEGFWVAVLPFKFTGANAELKALAEGLTEEIITGLSRFSYLRVIARGSTLRYENRTIDMPAVGNELGARYVMDGSLRQAGPTVRLAVQLVDTSTGAHLWAETYNRSFSLEGVFELQDDLVPRIVSTVADWYGVLPHSMSEAVRLKSSDQLSPYEAVLRSFGYYERITPEEHAAVRPSLERAVEQSPGNADGWAMLSMIYGEEHRFGFNELPDSLGRSLQAAQRAVDAAHANHFAWLALAQALFFRKEFDAFRDAAQRAIALNPMDGSTVEYLGHLIAFSGDWERGCELAERARQLNPNHPAWYWAVPFLDAYRKGDYRNARTFLLKGNQQRHFFVQALLAAVHGQLGEREAADKFLQEVLTMKPDFPLTGRDDFGKWYPPELVERLMDGLRKAGLEIVGEQTVPAPLPVTDVTETHSVVGASGSRPAIAVLPFANMSADSDQEYFSDGLAEEIINLLAQVAGLKVIARTSAFAFRGKEQDIREIAAALGVSTILQGSVRRAGSRLRVTAQLIDAADGDHLWAERFDREMTEVFAVQDEIAAAIASALRVTLTGQPSPTRPYEPNLAAYEAFLKGRHHYYKFSPEEFTHAEQEFTRASVLDTQWAEPHAALGDVYFALAFYGWRPLADTVQMARDEAQKAVAILPSHAMAHAVLAAIAALRDYDWQEAEAQFGAATASGSLDPIGRMMCAMFYLLAAGRLDDAAREMALAIAEDPLNAFWRARQAWILLCGERYEEAIAEARKALEFDDTNYQARMMVALSLTFQGKLSEARIAAEEVFRLAPWDALGTGLLAGLLAQAGDRDRAAQLIPTIASSGAAPVGMMMYHLVCGEIDAAIDCYQKDIELKRPNAPMIAFAGFLRPLHEHPRWPKIAKMMNLPDRKTDPRRGRERATMILSHSPPARFASVRHTVGRTLERNELRAAFDAAKIGRGSLLCVAGEPGIGKTTLVEDFLAELTDEQQSTIARGRCSERLAGTEAYLPLLDALESLLKSDKSMAQTMKQLAPTWYAQVVPLSGENDESARLLAEVKAASQERMKRELATFLQSVAQAQPLVIFVDDLHWADVSTIDLLSFLAGKFDTMPALIVTTYRPSDMLLSKHPFLQIKPDLQARGLCRELSLEFLNAAEIAEYLALEFPGHRFPPEFPQLIHAKTEGSPLFMADLVRYLRHRSVIADTSGSWTLAQALPDLERELPESVRGMIERKVAQLSEEDLMLLTAASVQGYEFDSAVVGQVLNLEADVVEERLEKLQRVFAFVKITSESEFPNHTLTLRYRFVHVLYQNALLTSIRPTRKATLSREVAQTLEGFYDGKASVSNELAALYEAGREFAKAAEYFQLAAEHSRDVFAEQEAAALASRGIEALKSLPETSERARRELALQVVLGLALRTIRGYSNPETGRAYARARELCRQIGETPELFPVLFGLWEFYQSTGELESAVELGEQLVAAAGQDESLLLVAHNVMGDHLTWLGSFVAAREHLEKGIALYDSEQHRSNVSQYGYDSGVACLGFASIVLWHLGYPDQALRRADEACDLASKLSHPLNLAYASSFAAWFHSLIGSMQSAEEQADSAIAISGQYDIAMFLAWGRLMKGWSLVGQGKIEEGMRLASQGAGEWRGTGTLLANSWCLGILAEGNLKAGHVEEARELLSQALDHVSTTGEHFYEAELYRLRGELLLKLPAGQLRSEAEDCFHQAIDVARKQQARSLELRAALSLSRLWIEDGKRGEARAVLSEIYDWFTEGFDTADLKDAKALLEELQNDNRAS